MEKIKGIITIPKCFYVTTIVDDGLSDEAIKDALFNEWYETYQDFDFGSCDVSILLRKIVVNDCKKLCKEGAKK